MEIRRVSVMGGSEEWVGKREVQTKARPRPFRPVTVHTSREHLADSLPERGDPGPGVRSHVEQKDVPPPTWGALQGSVCFPLQGPATHSPSVHPQKLSGADGSRLDHGCGFGAQACPHPVAGVRRLGFLASFGQTPKGRFAPQLPAGLAGLSAAIALPLSCLLCHSPPVVFWHVLPKNPSAKQCVVVFQKGLDWIRKARRLEPSASAVVDGLIGMNFIEEIK